MNNEYYVSLDLGSDSVGWATSDEDYNFLRLKGKTAFGSRIFSEAQSCKDRRAFRATKRRVNRRKYRIYLLNQLFADDINKVDKNFFARLSNSTYQIDDKRDGVKGIKNVLFNNPDQERQFYKDYPTIWHLRRQLVENDQKALSDIRNVYFAVHHIIKYRGNFLKEGEINYKSFDYEILNDLNETLKINLVNEDGEIEFENNFISSLKGDALKTIILNDDLNKATKQKQIKALFENVDDSVKPFVDLFSSLVTGGKIALSKVVKDYEDKDAIEFNAAYDDKVEEYASLLEDNFRIVLIAKEIYDYTLLNKLLGDKTDISAVMEEVYKTHRDDLKKLKQVIKAIDEKKGTHQELYTSVFKDKDKLNYAAFVHNQSNKDRISLADFNTYIAKILDENKEYINEKDYNELKSKTDKKILLQTIAHVSTSLIPHQLHLKELNAILDNAGKIYPSIKENKDKIIAIFKFRVPYYYGPLDDRSKYSNVVRKSNETITPWNVESIIDENETRVKFMNKLTNNCRYLLACKVLPKTSLLYEEYMILDRLNIMKINGDSLTKETKDELLKFIYSKNKTTINSIQNYLMKLHHLQEKPFISGISNDVGFEATSRVHLQTMFDLEKDFDNVEQYIFLATVYADDKKSLDDILDKQYHLSKPQIKCINSLITKKWAPLSRELLDGYKIGYTDDLGQVHTVISLMRETNKNFQMIINDSEYGIMKRIDEFNKEMQGERTDEDIIQQMLDETPAIFRRSINQTLEILDDITKITKKDPKKIFIEVTREDLKNRDKNQVDSRKKELENFISSLKKDADSLISSQANKVYEELEDEKVINKLKLRSKHVYLYFKQLGLDLYTGKKINLEDVLNSNKYDTDHIIPQSLLKDDSLDNLVLVSREKNQNIKKDYYPIPFEIRNESNLKLWKYLFEKKAISEKKYNNLKRSTEITLDELEQFVARQINVVNYSNVVVRNILNIKYPNTKVVFSKAQYPSYIRKTLGIAKVRELNDAHHAVDAYLNIVAGDILSTRFSNIRKIYEDKKKNYGDEKTFNMERVLTYYLNKDNLKDRVKNNSLRHDALVTFKTEYNNGAYYKQTIYKKDGNSSSLIPIHTSEDNPMSDTSKYGGYLSLSTSSLVLVQYTIKKKTVKKIETIKSLYKQIYKDDIDRFTSTLAEEGATDIKILRYIPLNQKIEYNGGIYCIYSNNENQNKYKQVYQNYIDNDLLLYYKFAFKHIAELDTDSVEIEVITDRKEQNKVIISKEQNRKVFNALVNNAKKPVYDSCNYIIKVRTIEEYIDFESLNLKNQIELITELIKYMSRASESSQIQKFNKLIPNGNLRSTKNITNNEIYIINESPTGLFTRKERI